MIHFICMNMTFLKWQKIPNASLKVNPDATQGATKDLQATFIGAIGGATTLDNTTIGTHKICYRLELRGERELKPLGIFLKPPMNVKDSS